MRIILFYDFNLTRLKVDDEGAAVTGVKETTRKATAYSHPKNDKIKFWDLPGIGMYQLLVWYVACWYGMYLV